MPLSPSVQISQTIGLPNIINLEDTSTGSDVDITSRRVFVITNANAYLVPSGTTTNYTVWALADTTIALDVLEQDMSLQITTDWLDINGAVLYTDTQLVNFEMFNAQFEYSLVSQEANGQASLNSINWLTSRMKLRLSLDDSNNAVVFASSINNGQNANDRGTYLRENPNLFY